MKDKNKQEPYRGRTWTMLEELQLIQMTEKGYTTRHIAETFHCETFDVIKRQFLLRRQGRLEV